MKRQRIFFIVDDLVFEVDKPEIYLEQLRVMELSKHDVDKKPEKENDDGILYIVKKDQKILNLSKNSPLS